MTIIEYKYRIFLFKNIQIFLSGLYVLYILYIHHVNINGLSKKIIYTQTCKEKTSRSANDAFSLVNIYHDYGNEIWKIPNSRNEKYISLIDASITLYNSIALNINIPTYIFNV